MEEAMSDERKGTHTVEKHDVVTEHFRCTCGHEWSREMYDGLIVVGCPACQREHLTMLGRVASRVFDRDLRDVPKDVPQTWPASETE
jgi:hypothetical protein